jgi:hypothetical protein
MGLEVSKGAGERAESGEQSAQAHVCEVCADGMPGKEQVGSGRR